MAGQVKSSEDRDLRLDFFRGLALWFIFVDHIPANQFAWATLRNYGLSDATEIFVFISGYTATLVYGRVFAERGFAFAAAKVLHRCWTLYITYMFLLFAFTAQVAYTARVFDNPLFREEMGIASYFEDPTLALVHALILMFRPANLDVLPLYIVLLLAFPLVLPGLVSRPKFVLAGSALLYLAARQYQWNLPTYPEGGVWYFNPFAWQFLSSSAGPSALPAGGRRAAVIAGPVGRIDRLSAGVAGFGSVLAHRVARRRDAAGARRSPVPDQQDRSRPASPASFRGAQLCCALLYREGCQVVERAARRADYRLRATIPSDLLPGDHFIVCRADDPRTIQQLPAGAVCDNRSGNWGDGDGRANFDLVSEENRPAASAGCLSRPGIPG